MNRGNICASIECSWANSFHAVADGDGSQAVAIIESIVADARHAVRNCDKNQTGTTREGIVANVGHAVANDDGGQPVATGEGIVTDARHGFSDYIFIYLFTEYCFKRISRWAILWYNGIIIQSNCI